MNRFAITLTMIMVVAAISGCRTAERVSYHQGIEMFGYPACQGTNPNLWDNCVGSSTVITSDARTGIQTLFIYKNGSPSDGPSRIISKVQGVREVCDQNKKNDRLSGWRTCRDAEGKITSREFFINGVESPETGAEIDRKIAAQRSADQEASYRKKCEAIGFNPGTEKFADCILRMMEMNSSPKTQTVIQNTTTGSDPAVRALLEEQKRQRELEGSLELMKKGLEMMQPPQSPTVRCTNNKATSTITCR